jgi:hypothetical protein
MSTHERKSSPAENCKKRGAERSSRKSFARIGTGCLGGKAQGLAHLEIILAESYDAGAFAEFEVDIPWFWAISTEWFDLFMEENRLYDIALSDTKDRHMASAFQRAELPEELIAQLREVIADVHAPLAVRSSSLLEDAMQEPFAGVYDTKLVPNNQFSSNARLKILVEAIKFVYASTFSSDAKSYRRAVGREDMEEKMAIMIQEVVGMRHGDRFYPNVSGVARSYNFYAMGHAQPENSVNSLALGLGKTIVEGGSSWTYCPVFPQAKPPYASNEDMLKQTQTEFWCINMGKPPGYAPMQETEYLLQGNLAHAEEDDVLKEIASTYNPQSDRLTTGIGSKGPRVLNFAPILDIKDIPLNDLVKHLLDICEKALGNAVEIEYAVNFNSKRGKTRFGFLQVRPMFVSDDKVEVQEHELLEDRAIVASEQVLGNGQLDNILDVVFIKRDVFSAKNTWLIAAELDEMNRWLLERERPYLLVVVGRLGTCDPWLGIPVKWGQVSGAKVIVEASSQGMNVDMSQGSHFFHNVACLRVLYFSADKTGKYPLRWDWLESHKNARESLYVRHIELQTPLHVKVDGKNCRGVVWHERADAVGD